MHSNSSHTAPKIGFISFRCPPALVDSERILTQLYSDGYDIVDDYENAGLVIVNTCGFIDSEIAESLNTIGESIEKNGKVIVTGCIENNEDTFIDLHPSVLAISGPHTYEQVMSQVYKHLPKPENNEFIDVVPPQGIKLTPRHYAYLKISEDYDHTCSFCITPNTRGQLISRPVEDIVDEAQRLALAGVQELLIVSQDTSAYGSDNTFKTGLTELCQTLSKLNIWTRLHYIYPYPSVDEIIPLMADGLVLPYLDIPLQHANHDILRAMERPAHAEKVIRRIEKWRDIAPDIALRSKFIVGYPGETEAQFQELLDFLSEVRFDRIGAFTFSDGERFRANLIDNQIAEEVQQERLERLMELQTQISAEKLADKIGSIQPVIIDDLVIDDEIENIALGRTIYDAPEIDGIVQIENINGVEPGQVVHVEIIDATDNDLIAIPA